jgi:Putative peptidoglycan binding domain
VQARLLPCAALATLSIAASLLAPIPDADAAFVRFGDRSLSRGDHGRDVRVLQRWMTRVGVRTRVDGVFGARTTRSVRTYERRSDMRVDGRVSRAEARGLRTRVAAAVGPAVAAVPAPAPPAVLAPDGRTAVAPAGAPPPVVLAIAAANSLTSLPYRYGGGHTDDFQDTAYDCSGAVSFVLHAAGLLESPMDSTGLMGFGQRGAGSWMTTYAHGDHAYIVIAGLRFDTSGDASGSGPRWHQDMTSTSGYVARHPSGF